MLEDVADDRGVARPDRVDEVEPDGSSRNCSSISASVDARPETGSQPSHTEKTSLSMRPAKKTGVA